VYRIFAQCLLYVLNAIDSLVYYLKILWQHNAAELMSITKLQTHGTYTLQMRNRDFRREISLYFYAKS